MPADCPLDSACLSRCIRDDWKDFAVFERFTAAESNIMREVPN
jgi:hypothetical protein